MRKTLGRPADRQEILSRLRQLSPQDKNRWGRMTVHGAVCHLWDAYEAALGKREVTAAPTRVPRGLYKRLALNMPMRWPRGVQTRPEVEQGKGGTPPGNFAEDLDRLCSTCARFCSGLPDRCPAHPVFGVMSREDWLRWGYLHADHHLRQFGR